MLPSGEEFKYFKIRFVLIEKKWKDKGVNYLSSISEETIYIFPMEKALVSTFESKPRTVVFIQRRVLFQ